MFRAGLIVVDAVSFGHCYSSGSATLRLCKILSDNWTVGLVNSARQHLVMVCDLIGGCLIRPGSCAVRSSVSGFPGAINCHLALRASLFISSVSALPAVAPDGVCQLFMLETPGFRRLACGFCQGC